MDGEDLELELDEALDNIKTIALRHALKSTDEESSTEDAPVDDEAAAEDDTAELLDDPRELPAVPSDGEREFIGGRGAPPSRPLPERPSQQQQRPQQQRHFGRR